MLHTLSWYISQQQAPCATVEERQQLVDFIQKTKAEELAPLTSYESLLIDYFINGQLTVMQLLTLTAIAPANPNSQPTGAG